MEGLGKLLAIGGLVLIAYAVFSRFYGMPSVALMQFRSANILVLGNTLLLLSLVIKNTAR